MTSELVMYTLISQSGQKSYTGVTNNITRRLRQHNGELHGGARRTHGDQWRVAFVVSGFDCDRTARQFEWRMHRKCRHRGTGAGNPVLHRRLAQFLDLLHMPRATSTCTPNASLRLTVTFHEEIPNLEQISWPLCVKKHVFVTSNNITSISS
jgi:predicted GIY-YIG superfamily endonuclease